MGIEPASENARVAWVNVDSLRLIPKDIPDTPAQF